MIKPFRTIPLLASIACISVVFAGRGAFHGTKEADRAAITAVLTEQQAAWNRGDVEAFLQGYWHSPELTFSGTSGIARGWDAVLARYKKNYPDRSAMGKLDFSRLEFRFLGPDAALVLGHWHLAREKGDVGRGIFAGLATLPGRLANRPRPYQRGRPRLLIEH